MVAPTIHTVIKIDFKQDPIRPKVTPKCDPQTNYLKIAVLGHALGCVRAPQLSPKYSNWILKLTQEALR